MKKIILTSLFFAITAFAFAQNKSAQFGLKAGITFPTISSASNSSIYDGPSDQDFKANPSFYIGGTVNLPVSDLFSVQPGITLIGKGGKSEVYESNFEPGNNLYVFSGQYKLSTMYIEIPVNAIFHFDAGNGQIFVGGGPYFGVAISGKTKRNGTLQMGSTSTSESIEQDISFGENEDLKRGDIGFNFLAGYQLNSGLNIHVGYGLGLNNINTNNMFKWRNRVPSVGIGFAF